MSAGSLPYHLRPNKAVERLLFVDLLTQLDRALSLEDHYHYFGFGGPQMEDFRVLHERFQKLRMYCIEEDEAVLARQKFNQPHTSITFLPCTSAKFLANYEPGRKRVIVWLDYAKANKRVAQVAEFQELLRKAPPLSVIKLTLNANAESLGGAPDDENRRTKQRDKLVAQFNRFLAKDEPEEIVAQQNFPSTLVRILDEAAREALSKKPGLLLQPLASFTYSDSSHAMLTFVGLLGTKDDVDDVMEKSRLRSWYFSRFDWSGPRDINVPELTAKERIHINQMLPQCQDKTARIASKLKFPLDPDPDLAKRKLSQYVDFYRHYPHFGRVGV
jgi:hypothetical protein